MPNQLGRLVVASLAFGAAALVPVSRAAACGGFFCNRPVAPDDLPVAQTAENVLFAMERGPDGKIHLEAHIQIFYTGPADQFSWVVPVDSMPTLSTGSDRIFQLLDAPTRPRFRLDVTTAGVCKDDGPTFGASASDSAKSGSSESGAPGNRGGVDVTFRGNVGPFDAAILTAGDPAALKAWLRENMYYLSDEGSKLLDDYVLEQKFFVALRLRPGKGTTEIRPIVLRFDGPGPCVPLRLTAVAALRDLKINLWVLAANRVVPENYYEIKINDARIDWPRNGVNYPDLVKQAADEAGGNAFTVDFAGDTAPLRVGLPVLVVDLTRLRTVTRAPDALDEIMRAGLAGDTTLLGILRQHIPQPQALKDMGIPENAFYNQLRFYFDRYPQLFDPVDGNALADQIDADLVAPQRQARSLLERFPKLTRLSTFISPEEMSVDPTFTENTTLPDVPATRLAVGVRECGVRAYTRCQAPLRVTLPDGQTIWYKAPAGEGWCGALAAYDRGGVDRMPALELGWMRQAAGEGRLTFDKRAEIARAIEDHNDDVQGCSCALGARPRRGAAWLLPLALLGVFAGRRRWRR
jgi:hypothetical protein